jgi:hypothetical protein
MVIALICVVSGVALAQFAIFYWRAMVAVVASAEVSPQIRQAAGIEGDTVRGEDFPAVITLHELCPELKPNGRGIKAVRVYYAALAALSHVGGPFSAWAREEMATCSRYVAARLDQRIQHNRAFLSQVRA